MMRLPKLPNSFLLGFGAGFLARDILASDASFTRPILKGVLRTGHTLISKGRESFAHFIETIEDLVAEVQAESREAAVRPTPSSEPVVEAAPVAEPVGENAMKEKA